VEYNEVFGCDSDIRFQLNWMIPVPVRFPPSLKRSLLGYDVPDMEPDETSGLVQQQFHDTDFGNDDPRSGGKSAVDGPTPSPDEDMQIPSFRKRAVDSGTASIPQGGANPAQVTIL
jgi:hypothetical protein